MNDLRTLDTIDTIPSYEVAEMMDKPHKDVLAMIHGNSQRKGIIQVLAEIQMYPSDYFIESTYIDASGKENVCYECTKLGCDMLANKMTGDKGIIFTAKYVKAFNEMQQQLIANALPVPQTINLLNVSYDPYNNYNFKQYLNKIKAKDIPEELQNFVQAHESDKPEKRLAAYNVAKNALEELKYLVEKHWERDMIQEELDLLNKRIELQKTYINRSKLGQATKTINKLQDTINHYELDVYDNYYMVDIHGFTVNCSYCASSNEIKCTKAYKTWKDKADVKMQDLPTFEELGLDPLRPKKVDMYFYLKDETFDVHNCGKSFLDALERHYKKECPEFNDNLFADARTRKYFSYSGSYDNGYIVFGIKDLTDEEINDLTFDESKGA